jgi:hypothetical protein
MKTHQPSVNLNWLSSTVSAKFGLVIRIALIYSILSRNKVTIYYRAEEGDAIERAT